MFPVSKSPLIEKYKGRYIDAQLCIDVKHKRMFIMVQVKMPDRDTNRDSEVRVVEMGG